MKSKKQLLNEMIEACKGDIDSIKYFLIYINSDEIFETVKTDTTEIDFTIHEFENIFHYWMKELNFVK